MILDLAQPSIHLHALHNDIVLLILILILPNMLQIVNVLQIVIIILRVRPLEFRDIVSKRLQHIVVG